MLLVALMRSWEPLRDFTKLCHRYLPIAISVRNLYEFANETDWNVIIGVRIGIYGLQPLQDFFFVELSVTVLIKLRKYSIQPFGVSYNSEPSFLHTNLHDQMLSR